MSVSFEPRAAAKGNTWSNARALLDYDRLAKLAEEQLADQEKRND
jgi:hypothetical protein